jgi:hypothetical protein
VSRVHSTTNSSAELRVPEGLELSPAPSVMGRAGAVAWYRDMLRIPITANYVKTKTEDGTLPSFLIGGALWYSTEDLYGLVMRTRRSGATV